MPRTLSKPQFIGSTLFTVLIAYLANTGDRWIPLLDGANLLFHEAGHPIFGVFSSRLGVYGGTLGQLCFPIGFTIYFLRQHKLTSAYLCFVWLIQNFWNIARYMSDARAQLLPLVGGGDHDWTEILSRWNVLELDIHYAKRLSVLAGAALVLGWYKYLKRTLNDHRT